MISNDASGISDPPSPQRANLDSTVPTPVSGVGKKEGDIHPSQSDFVRSSSFPPPNRLTNQTAIPRTERRKFPSQPNLYTGSLLSLWKPLVPSPAPTSNTPIERSNATSPASFSDPGNVLGDGIYSSPKQIEKPLQDTTAEPTEEVKLPAENIGGYPTGPVQPYPRLSQSILQGNSALGSDDRALSGEIHHVVNSGLLAVQEEESPPHTYPPLPHSDSEAPVPHCPTLLSGMPSTSTFNPDLAKRKIEGRFNAFNPPHPFLGHGRSRGKDLELLDTPIQEGHSLRRFKSTPSPGLQWANITPRLSNVRLNHQQHPAPSTILPESGIATSSSHQAIGPLPVVASEIEPINAHSGPLPQQMSPGEIESGEGASQAQGWMRGSRRLNRIPSPFPPRSGYEPMGEESQTQNFFIDFIVDSVIAQIYLWLLLRVPGCYYSRVSRIFTEARLSMPEIEQMALETAGEGALPLFDPEFEHLEPGKAPDQFLRLKSAWEEFIDSVMQEWKTCNIISVLLLSYVIQLDSFDS